MTFLDTVMRVEHSPGDGQHGTAVEVHVQRWGQAGWGGMGGGRGEGGTIKWP